MIVVGLRTLLLAQSAITSLAGQRVYVNRAEQGAPVPYLIITTIETDRMLALDGTYGMREAQIDVDCYAASYPAAKAMADAVATFLDDYSGAAGADDAINAVLIQGEGDDYLSPQDSGQAGRHVVTLELQIQYTPN